MQFVVCIVKHCNLNCISCDHFSPLSDPVFIQLSEYKKNIRRMADITEGHVDLIDIEGGEPLLHPDIVEFIKITRNAFPKTDLKVFTNGILLTKMNDLFWKVCRENNTTLRLTRYPISIDYNYLKQYADKRGVKLEYANEEYEKLMTVQAIDIEGKQDPVKSYANCYMSNGICAELNGEKLFTCTQASNLPIFAGFFNLDIKIENEDYLNIYDDLNLDMINDYLNRPIEACKYCKTSEWNHRNKWKVSEKKIEEWTGISGGE